MKVSLLRIAALGGSVLMASAALAAAPAVSASAGKQAYAQNCASCHGEAAKGGYAPALTKLAARKDKRAVDMIIRKPGPAMPPLYPATISDKDVGNIVAYLKSIQ